MNRRTIAGWAGIAIMAGTVGTVALWSRARAQDVPHVRTEKQSSEPHLLVDVVRPRAVDTAATVRLTGQVEAYRVAAVASEVSDRVQSRLVERGDRVTVGQSLFILNNDLAVAAVHQAEATAARATAARKQAEADYARAAVETEAQVSQSAAQLDAARAAEQKARSYTRSQELAQAQAALASARADETLARKDYDRYDRLLEEGAIPRQTLDRARSTLDAAVARRESAEQGVSLAKEGARTEDIAQAAAQVSLAQAGLEAAHARPQRLEVIRRQIDALRAQEQEARAGLEQARIAVSKRKIAAPFNGRVLETLIETGEMAAPGRAMVRIADVKTVKAVFALPEMLRGTIHPGDRVTLTADGLPGQAFAGRAKVVGYEADNRARTFPVEIAIANPAEKILPGMVVRLAVPDRTKTGPAKVVVPVASVASDGAQSYVFRIVNHQVQRQNVSLGGPVGTDHVEILNGLTANEPIAAAPQRLTDGAKITVNSNGLPDEVSR